MVKLSGLPLVGGVLLVLMGLSGVAAEPSGPHSMTEPPHYGEIQQVISDGEDAAEGGAAQAQAQADEAQQQVAGTTEKLASQASVASDKTFSTMMELLGDAELLAINTANAVIDLLMKAVPPGSTSETDSGTPGSYHAQASTVQPAAGLPAAAIVLVLVAGAAGGVLLWYVVLQRAITYGLVPLLSRIARSDLYNNDSRRMISDLVATGPGVCLNEIVEKTGFSRNAVSYHLFVLEKEEELVSVKDGKYRRYFPRVGKYVNGAKNVVSVLRNETSLRIAQHVVVNPGTIQRDLCVVVGSSASALCWHMKRLENLHVVRKERDANTVRYFPGEAVSKYDLSDFGLGHGPSAAPSAAP